MCFYSRTRIIGAMFRTRPPVSSVTMLLTTLRNKLHEEVDAHVLKVSTLDEVC